MPSPDPQPPHFTTSPLLTPRYIREKVDPGSDLLAPEELTRYLDDLQRRVHDPAVLHPTVSSGRPIGYPQNPSLIPSADGKIAKILLTIPAYAVDERPLKLAFQDLVRQLPPDTDIVLVTDAAVAS